MPIQQQLLDLGDLFCAEAVARLYRERWEALTRYLEDR